jgi:hypothetical protein
MTSTPYKDDEDPLTLDRSYKQPAVDIWRYPSPRFRAHDEPIGLVADEAPAGPDVLFGDPVTLKRAKRKAE